MYVPISLPWTLRSNMLSLIEYSLQPYLVGECRNKSILLSEASNRVVETLQK